MTQARKAAVAAAVLTATAVGSLWWPAVPEYSGLTGMLAIGLWWYAAAEWHDGWTDRLAAMREAATLEALARWNPGDDDQRWLARLGVKLPDEAGERKP